VGGEEAKVSEHLRGFFLHGIFFPNDSFETPLQRHTKEVAFQKRNYLGIKKDVR
jgi:hypothetical protein